MKSNSLRSAFSLVELSIVVLIMGATTASLVGANNMIKKSRLVKAKSETSSSPVKNMNGLILWYEATMEASTNAATNGTNISVWNDLSPNKTNATQATSGNQPQYIDSAINKLPAIKFDGSNDLMNFVGSAIANNNYTIIVVEQRRDGRSNNYFLGGTGSGNNSNLYLGYSDNSHIIHGQTSNYYTINTASYGFFSTPKIHIFTHNSNSGKKYYQNTGSLGSGAETSPKALVNYTGARIGGNSSNFYYGDIGEIIAFNRTLNDVERSSIENYLAKKWYINIQPANVPTNTNSCTVPSLPGISQTQVNNAGGNLSCSGTNFDVNSSVSYTCSGGSFNNTTYCSCITGYSVVGTACTPITCNITSVAGLNNNTGLAYASSATAIPNSPTAACATGYSGSPTYTCTANEMANIVSNCTPITCNITSVAGLNNKTGLAYASSATAIPNSPTSACESGYAGSPTYTCTANGAATIVSNNCISTCTSGSQTFNYTGSSQSFTVPDGCARITINAYGAQGTAGTMASGKGGRAQGVATVTSGQSLTINVGGQNGYNGGGKGHVGKNGGGMSSVYIGGTLSLVAGGGGGSGNEGYTGGTGSGGGGSGQCGANYCGGGGGDGWGFAGVAGGVAGGASGGPTSHGGGGSGGGLNSGGGGAKSSINTGGSGSYLQGGNAVSTNGCSAGVAAGGGGYYGGGAAAGRFCGAGQGGGGSSWTGSLTSPVFQGGVKSGNGQVIISW